ncbi:hypothetical protein [Nocardioides montaniterrae]
MANSHKRDTTRRRPRAAFIAGPLAVLATGVAVAFGVLGSGAGENIVAVDHSAADLSAATRPQTISRSAQRPVARPALRPLEQKWTTDSLNLWTRPRGGSKVGEIDARKKIQTSGAIDGDRIQILVGGNLVWVTKGYLADKLPAADPATMGLDFSPCGDMGVTRGLVPDMIRAYEAVCNAFPGQVSTYGGLGPREEHNTGHAVDAMVYTDAALGQRIADFLQAHAAELNLYDIIWEQHIWTPVRASEGWRLMPNRGGATANHMDHVHFAVN